MCGVDFENIYLVVKSVESFYYESEANGGLRARYGIRLSLSFYLFLLEEMFFRGTYRVLVC